MRRPKHWLDFAPFVMAHDPLKMTIEEAQSGNIRCVVTKLFAEAKLRSDRSDSARADPDVRIGHLVARLFFRGIYFPQMGTSAWLKLLFRNRKTIFKLIARRNRYVAAGTKRNSVEPQNCANVK